MAAETPRAQRGAAAMDETLDLAKRSWEDIPRIDLRQHEDALVPALRRACEHPGFFYLEGLPSTVEPAASAAMEAARRFFRQPMEAKLQVENSPAVQYRVRDPRTGIVHTAAGTGNGYRPPGGDIYFKRDQRESVNFGREPLQPGEEPPYGNVWPDDSLHPDGWRYDPHPTHAPAPMPLFHLAHPPSAPPFARC